MSDNTGATRQERRAGGRYTWEFGIGIVLFIACFLLLPNLWPTESGTWQRAMVALVPILPLSWSTIAMARHLRRMDEMQHVVVLRSFTFGFAATMLTTLAVALLRGGGIAVPGGEWIIFIAGMSAWGLAIPVCFARSGR